MSADDVTALVLFLFPLAYSPGPGNAIFAAIGAMRGVRAALPALAGYHVATFLMTALIGVGMGVALVRHPIVVDVLVLLGSMYVAWLSWTFLLAARSPAALRAGSLAAPRLGFWTGAAVLLLNPKAYYIVVVMFTRFLWSPPGGDVATALVITTIFTVNNLVAFVVWAMAGRGLAALFRSPRAARRLNYLFASVLGAVAVWMAMPLLG
ncbi:LysE family translocator [Aeromicrobium sp. YIM 150415]|uniref:LysE family translocator n=1 Tax=Aeromicrobium sp. YIM 150415 TaxID=2803912 RepID=UPI0019649D7D|nr:LysE family translocator [Aeromicrobium sp. YIM 150415]MBM9465195.1 LysE family translocator [Aeromicrobium sp. YIM 150415]